MIQAILAVVFVWCVFAGIEALWEMIFPVPPGGRPPDKETQKRFDAAAKKANFTRGP